MRLSVKLSEDAIVVVKGRAGRSVLISDSRRYVLPEGTLINDVITDEAAFKSVLEEIKKQYPVGSSRVYLTFGSNRIITKIMQVPKMSRKQLLYVVEKELENYLMEEKEMVYDYSLIRCSPVKNQGNLILAAAVEKEKIVGYKEIFRECGLKVVSMNTGLNALVQMVEHLTELEGKTYILAVLDGRNMQTSLYIHGIYRHTGRSRFLYERGARELVEEVVKDIGAIHRFAKSLEEGTPVTTVYVCGVLEEERECLFRMLKEDMGMEGRLLEQGSRFCVRHGLFYQLSDYVHATGSLFGR